MASPCRCWRCGGDSAISSALVLAICAFGGFTFRIGEQWGFGRARQTWDAKAFLCIPLTFVLIIATGYVGSFIVLVPGAQTFESLKDLVVLLCIVLFGYPALITVPFAYVLSDLIEGVPPDFVLDWLQGYFFWTAFVWMAYQLIGRDPDFRRARTWGRYGVFVVLIMLLDPVMWGFICSGKFTSAISYRKHHSGPVLHADASPGSWRPSPCWSPCRWPGGSDGSGRRSPATSGSARSGTANGPGKRVAAGRRATRARCTEGPADSDLHLHPVHRTGARNGRRHGDRCASERGR